MGKDVNSIQLKSVLGDMSASISSVRDAIQLLHQSSSTSDFKDGISLLSLKHQTLISYLNSLVLLSSRRATGHFLNTRARMELPFSASERPCRNNGLGDLVDAVVEGRVVLEKIRLLETKIRYQIDKLVRVAEESENTADIAEDPLAYRPKPHDLVAHDEKVEDAANEYAHNDHSYQEKRGISNAGADANAIYRPPRVAPVPYTEKSKSKRRKEHMLVPSALASLSLDVSRPHVESTSGLGSTPSLASGRAAYLKRLNEFEEDNFSRVVMKKSDAKRRERDEADLALGGSLTGSGKHRRRAGGLEDEFGDVLRSVERVSFGGFGTKMGDGYDELRQQSKKVHFLQRSRQEGSQKRIHTGEEVFGHARKKSRFEVEAKNMKKRLGRKD